MVGQYKKVNEMTKCHAAFLPNMEQMIEGMASCRWKSKMDLRSGFWQVGMTERAKDLTAFCTPSGRCFRWNCMPFGLQGAPGIFQEMMEQVCNQTKANPEVAKILNLSTSVRNAYIGAFFDDSAIAAQTPEAHSFLLEDFFKVVQKNQLRIKLSKCDFMREKLEYLGYEISWGTWRPIPKKVNALAEFKIRSLKDLRTFLGACNFYRRHVKNFTFSSAPLTELLKKNARFHWGPLEEAKLEEIKAKLLSVSSIGVPRSTGEIILVTDASDIGGGATIFQWQNLDQAQVPPEFQTTGMSKDGLMVHNYPENFRLVPLGHWNWKWNPTRQRYFTYEQELLAGVLTISTQSRILQNLPIVWFCDHEALKTFLDKEPPVNHRLRRWYCYLSQFRLKIEHIPGLKNEFCDWLSRLDFDHKFDFEFEKLAHEAFERMDSQLDLSMRTFTDQCQCGQLPLIPVEPAEQQQEGLQQCNCSPLFNSGHVVSDTSYVSRASSENVFLSSLSTHLPSDRFCNILTLLQNLPREVNEDMYKNSEFSEVWFSLEPWKAKVISDFLWFRTDAKLFCERKLAIPNSELPIFSTWVHKINGHPGPERTMFFFLRNFYVQRTRTELLQFLRNILGTCEKCIRSKPSSSIDRGLVGCLPIPSMVNDIIYIDFVQLDEFNNFDYALDIVDGLSRFVQYIPCTKPNTGEKVLKVILKG